MSENIFVCFVGDGVGLELMVVVMCVFDCVVYLYLFDLVDVYLFFVGEVMM